MPWAQCGVEGDAEGWTGKGTMLTRGQCYQRLKWLQWLLLLLLWCNLLSHWVLLPLPLLLLHGLPRCWELFFLLLWHRVPKGCHFVPPSKLVSGASHCSSTCSYTPALPVLFWSHLPFTSVHHKLAHFSPCVEDKLFEAISLNMYVQNLVEKSLHLWLPFLRATAMQT